MTKTLKPNVVTISICCEERFVVPARYAFTMLGLIAGFRPRFLPGDSIEAMVMYGYEKPDAIEGMYLPASRDAHAFLLRKNPYDASRSAEGAYGGIAFLSLFAVDSDPDSSASPQSDIISAAFFFLSLHEEWSCSERDQFSRFQARDSLLGKLDALYRPVLFEYAEVLRVQLLKHGTTVADGKRFDGRPASVCMTHDIDYISKLTPGFLYREMIRYLLLNELGQPFAARLRRFKEFAGFINPDRDPYLVSIRRMLDLEQSHGIHAAYFVKAGGRDKHDARYDLHNHVFRKFLERMKSENHEIGLHPSFRSVDNKDVLPQEKSVLEAAIGRSITSVRQHYLRFEYPRTWHEQGAQGIRIDSTLGFAEHEGFRNGACHPFLAYDLDRSQPLNVWEFPLAAMDGTLAFYRGLSPEESFSKLTALLDRILSARGCGVFLFHNTCFDEHDASGWDKVFTEFVTRIAGQSEFMTETPTQTLDAWVRSCGYDSSKSVSELLGN